jgi:hypothetical protein
MKVVSVDLLPVDLLPMVALAVRLQAFNRWKILLPNNRFATALVPQTALFGPPGGSRNKCSLPQKGFPCFMS